MARAYEALIACHDCDLLLRERLGAPTTANVRCPRCSALLYRERRNALEKALALCLAALALLIVANSFPLVGLDIQGQHTETTVLGAVVQLWRDGMLPLSVLVALTTTLLPAVEMTALLWLLFPLWRGRRPPAFATLYRIIRPTVPWAMVDVFILGVLVSLVKLGSYAEVLPGPAIWCFGALMLILVWLTTLLDGHELWRLWESLETPGAFESNDAADGAIDGVTDDTMHAYTQVRRTTPPTADGSGLLACHVCGQLANAAGRQATDQQTVPRCRRCAAPLHRRKPDSLIRAWAYLIAAYALYLPANLLPIMETRSLFGVQSDTIMSGVVYLWVSGSWSLAIIVFVASIAVPLLKLVSLTFLLLSLRFLPRHDPVGRTRLYRFLELIGRWSMLDIYVITILVALVQANALASIAPGMGALAFAVVVVLSMLATSAFDPRLIWDAYQNASHPSHGETTTYEDEVAQGAVARQYVRAAGLSTLAMHSAHPHEEAHES